MIKRIKRLRKRIKKYLKSAAKAKKLNYDVAIQFTQIQGCFNHLRVETKKEDMIELEKQLLDLWNDLKMGDLKEIK